MRTIEEILDTAFIIMMLSDRGLLEKEEHEGCSYPIEDREEKRKLFVDILKSRSLYGKLTSKEVEIITSKVEKLSEDSFYLTQMQYEAIPVLLWAVGLSDFPEYNAKLCDVDFHPILGKHRTDQTKIDRQDLFLDREKINSWKNIALLWHWRSREGISNQAINNKDIVEYVVQIFGDDYENLFSNIPLSKKYPMDFMVNNEAFNKLSPQKGDVLLVQAKWRHHALEWITSDVAWEETDTST
jgi:hypothetical protein